MKTTRNQEGQNVRCGSDPIRSNIWVSFVLFSGKSNINTLKQKTAYYLCFPGQHRSYMCVPKHHKAKSNPITDLDRPRGFQEVEAPRFQDSRHIKMVTFLALHTGRFYPQEIFPGTHFCQTLSRPQGHSAARRIMSMKNSNDTIGNRTRDLPTFSAMPQPTAPRRTPRSEASYIHNCINKHK